MIAMICPIWLMIYVCTIQSITTLSQLQNLGGDMGPFRVWSGSFHVFLDEHGSTGHQRVPTSSRAHDLRKAWFLIYGFSVTVVSVNAILSCWLALLWLLHYYMAGIGGDSVIPCTLCNAVIIIVHWYTNWNFVWNTNELPLHCVISHQNNNIWPVLN